MVGWTSPETQRLQAEQRRLRLLQPPAPASAPTWTPGPQGFDAYAAGLLGSTPALAEAGEELPLASPSPPPPQSPPLEAAPIMEATPPTIAVPALPPAPPRTVGNRNPRTAAGVPPGKDQPLETQAPAQYSGPTQEEGTIPTVSPREERADPNAPSAFEGRYRQRFQTPNEMSLGDWAKEIQRREGPKKLAANSTTRTYTNKDLDEVVAANRGSVMQVSKSSTTDQDVEDLDHREAREDTEFRAGQAKLNATIYDPTGSKAREEAFQNQLKVAQVQSSGRQRSDELQWMQNERERGLFAAEDALDAQVAAGTITAPQAEIQKRSLRAAHAEEMYRISRMRQQREQNKNSRQGLIFADDGEEPPVIAP